MSADKPKRSQELVPLPAAPLAPATQAPEPPVTQISLKEIQAYVAEHCRNQLGEPIRDWKPQNILAQMSVDPNNGGAFGLAVNNLGWGTIRLAAVDDNANQLKIWTTVIP